MPKADRIIRERNGSSIGVGRKCQHDALTAVTTVSTALKRCRILRSSHPTEIFFFSDFIFVLGAVRTPWILRSRYFVKWGICARARVTSARQKSGLCCVSSPPRAVWCGCAAFDGKSGPACWNLGRLARNNVSAETAWAKKKKKSTHCQSQLKS